MSGKFKKKSLPKTTKEFSKEQLLEILKKKKECNTRVLRIVEALCEAHIEQEWFLRQLIHINQSHYDDVVTERSIIHLCGYPLCSNSLSDIPKQQYKISLSQKTVHDITDRKKYCSHSCFMSGEFVKNQLLTSPLWFRDSEEVPDFKLLPKKVESVPLQKAQSELGECSAAVKVAEDVEKTYIDAVEGTNTQADCLEEKCNVENKEQKGVEKESPYTTVECLDLVAKVEKAVDEWLNIKTLIYLLGEEAVKEKLNRNETVFKEIFETVTDMTPYHEKFEELSKVFSLLNFGCEGTAHALKPLPDYSALKTEAENLNVKVRAYYSGCFEMAESSSTAEGDVEEKFELPLVDSHAQNALRRRVFMDRLNRLIPDVTQSLAVFGEVSSSQVSTLVKTFCLSAHNVTFQPREWYLIALILIKLLSLKEESLRGCLVEDTPKDRTNLLLLSYNLSPDYLDNLIGWLTDPEHLLTKLR